MKNFTVAATLLVATLSALADGATYESPQPVTSNRSRIEVQAEAIAARSRGELRAGELSHVAAPTGRALTRQEVLADVAAARANNELDFGERGYVWENHARRDSPSALAAKTNGNVR